MEFLNKSVKVESGFIKDKIEREHHKKGDGMFAGEILQPSGQWTDYLPAVEPQNKYFETYCCTVFNTIKPVCILAKRKFGEDWDKAERFNSVLANIISGHGGSPHTASETIRKNGVIEQSSLPWTEDLYNFWRYARPNPMTEPYLTEGNQWLRSYTFGHDWVYSLGSSRLKQWFASVGYKLGFKTIQEAMMDALQYSPLGVSVYAWQLRNGLAYKNTWQQDNHWTCCVGYVKDQYWIIYDSYLNCNIKCEWGYPFGFVKRYSLDKADFADRDAEYIKLNMNATNVKGDLKAGIYFIFNGEKRPYRNTDEYNKICDRWFETRNFKVVANDALDLLPLGEVMDYDVINKIVPFFTPVNP